jgi:hypothetical protein
MARHWYFQFMTWLGQVIGRCATFSWSTWQIWISCCAKRCLAETRRTGIDVGMSLEYLGTGSKALRVRAIRGSRPRLMRRVAARHCQRGWYYRRCLLLVNEWEGNLTAIID